MTEKIYIAGTNAVDNQRLKRFLSKMMSDGHWILCTNETGFDQKVLMYTSSYANVLTVVPDRHDVNTLCAGKNIPSDHTLEDEQRLLIQLATKCVFFSRSDLEKIANGQNKSFVRR